MKGKSLMQLWNSSTLWTEPPFIVSFMIKEENSWLICLNHIKPLKSPEPELFWTSQSCFLLLTGFFSANIQFFDNHVLITEPTVPLSSKIASFEQHAVHAQQAKILLNSYRVWSSPKSRKRIKALQAGWWKIETIKIAPDFCF